jgi:hypothetical protein
MDGRFVDAEQQVLLSLSSTVEPIEADGARAVLAECYRAQGRYDDARATYDALALSISALVRRSLAGR